MIHILPRSLAGTLAALLMTASATTGQAAPASTPAQPSPAQALFEKVKDSPARLRVFLAAMPKGGDLHNHLWGQPHAEQFLAWAGEQDLCVSRTSLAIVAPPCSGEGMVPARGLGRADEALYAQMIDALSTRGRGQGLGVNDKSGHDDFFETFGHFYPVAIASAGPMLASAKTSAAMNRVSYLELIQNPPEVDKAGSLVAQHPFSPDALADALAAIAPAMPALVDAAIKQTDAMEAEAAKRLACGSTPANAPAPCKVVTRYHAYALRSQQPAFVFGQMALAFALAEKDPRYVSVNIVAPEDGAVALADFDLHMAMYAFFHARHPKVKLSLHAGELTLGLVPPADLADHIRRSIDIAGASRIGHGIDVSYEENAGDLLALMARKRVAVEINLTSNDTILGVSGKAHPLALYRTAGVPTVLSTDDEGVSRSDMTNEYVRAVTEQGLDYAALKDMARASLEYAFLPGASLWGGNRIGQRSAPCTSVSPTRLPDSASPCGQFLATSEKAQMQWRLEGDFTRFEHNIVAHPF